MSTLYTVSDDTTLPDGFVFHKGEVVSFDGLTIHHEFRDFLGFVTERGLFAYTNDACSDGKHIPVAIDLSSLIGATILSVSGLKMGGNEVCIYTDKGTLRLLHERECCERVEILDVCGDVEDLLGGYISVIECRTGRRDGKAVPPVYQLSPKKILERAKNHLEWRKYTFYEIRTSKGDVTVRWGEPDNSNDNRYGEEISAFFLPV